MKKIKILKGLLLTTLLVVGYFASAQTFTIEGTIRDSIAKRNLPSATISIVKAKDSSLVSFARSNEQGHFTIKNIAAGSYLLSLSYVGY